MLVKRELIFALQQNRFENRMVPLLWQACDFDRLSWVLPSFQIIDVQRTFEDGCHDLLRLWGSRLPTKPLNLTAWGGPNRYEDSLCQETHHPSERGLCCFPRLHRVGMTQAEGNALVDTERG